MLRQPSPQELGVGAATAARAGRAVRRLPKMKTSSQAKQSEKVSSSQRVRFDTIADYKHSSTALSSTLHENRMKVL